MTMTPVTSFVSLSSFPLSPNRRSHISSRVAPRCSAGSKSKPSNPIPERNARDGVSGASEMQNSLVAALREEIPSIFDPSDPGPNLKLYTPDVSFRDPLNRFTGAARYAANIAFLTSSPVFSDPILSLHDVWPVGDSIVRTRWTLAMTAGLPWRPRVSFTGTSDYVLDPQTGLVCEHVDVWDSLDAAGNRAFPSVQAIRDLVSQCAFAPPALPDASDGRFGGPYELLRRTKLYSIRRYPGTATFWLGLEHGKSSPNEPSLSVVSGSIPQNRTGAVEVAVLRFPGEAEMASVSRAQEELVGLIAEDQSARLSSQPVSWLVRYPASLRYPDELWVTIEKFETRT